MIDTLTLENTGTTASGHGSKIKFIVGTSVSNNTSSIAAQREGTAGNTNLVFGTNSTERMRILSGGGLTFNGDTAQDNALDDYEEGTWTPTIVGNGGASGQSYAIQSGRYTKIGNVATYHFDVQLSAKGTLSGTYMLIGGLPYNSDHGANCGGSGHINYASDVTFGSGDGRNVIKIYVNNGTNSLSPNNTTGGGVSLWTRLHNTFR